MVTIKQYYDCAHTSIVGKISLKQLYLSPEKQQDCFLKLYFITLDKIYGQILTNSDLFSKWNIAWINWYQWNRKCFAIHNFWSRGITL